MKMNSRLIALLLAFLMILPACSTSEGDDTKADTTASETTATTVTPATTDILRMTYITK